MSSKVKLRKDQKHELNGLEYKYVGSLLKNENGVYVKQCPTGVAVIGRLLKIINEDKRSKQEAYHIVANELQEIWIYGMNIYPKTIKNIINSIKNVYEGKRKKGAGMDSFQSFTKIQRDKRNDKWKEKVEKFNNKMLTGFDIRTIDRNYQNTLEESYGVKMSPAEEEIHSDNCKQKTCSCLWTTKTPCKDCPRQMYVDDKTDSGWEKWKQRKDRENAALQKQREEADTSLGTIQYEQVDDMKCTEESDVTFEVSSKDQSTSKKRINHRSSFTLSEETNTPSSSNNGRFPEVLIRFSRQNFNPKVMRAVTHIQATYKLSSNDAMGVCVDIANMIFEQSWEKAPDFTIENNSSDDEEDKLINEDSNAEDDDQNEWIDANAKPRVENEPINDQLAVCRKKRRIQKDLRRRFPHRSTRRKWLRQGALLNLRYVAQRIIHKKEGQVITLGFDDTSKAAGERLHDVKTTHITINGDDMDKETFTTGFTPNLSHSGLDQATTLRHKLQTLAVLAGRDGDTSVQDIIDSIDFWMSDRSSDGDIVLDNLGIEERKILKCSAHIILAIDEAIESVFKEIEQKVGRDTLTGDEGMKEKMFMSKNSIITLGLIAIAKCLSPSHAALSYSLYQQYKDWRESKGLPISNFKGFVSNRFGRTAFLASLFIEHYLDLKEYWDTCVDEHSNKLILALHSYFNNEWFFLGCQVFSKFNQVIIEPLCNILGIDQQGKVRSSERSWDGVKEFFSNKVDELKEMRDESECSNSVEKVICKCSGKIIEALERQLAKVKFFRDEAIDNETTKKMKRAPLTNSGCESRMAELNVRVKYCGGSTPINTISDMQSISANKFLLTDDFDDPEKTSELFKWARTSEEAKRANEMEKDFLDKVKLVHLQASKAKQLIKSRRIQRSLDLLHVCQQHGGPVTHQNIELLDTLKEEEIIDEVKYLKVTIAKDIRMKKRITNPITKKYTYQKLPVEQLKISIRNVVKPLSCKPDKSVDELLSNVL